MWTGGLLTFYCLLIVLASLGGGSLPGRVRLTHVRVQLMMSFVSGLMIGIALLHLLPHAAKFVPDINQVAAALLAGLLVMFFLLRLFHVHHHGDDDAYADACHHVPDHHHSHPHDHAAHDHGYDRSVQQRRLGWLGLLFGLAIHTLLDGVALGASVVAEASGHQHRALFGLGTFLAVVLHKPLDALSITYLMGAGGWPARSRTWINCGFAMMCPLGALLFWLGVDATWSAGAAPPTRQSLAIGFALAFSAGFFLCIALADLLPEVKFHSHDRSKLSAALLLGVAMAVAIEMLPNHGH